MRENISSLLGSVQDQASGWFASIDTRPVRATLTTDELQQALGGPLPQSGMDPEALVGILAEAGMRGTVASA